MTQFILNLLGARVDAAGDIAGMRLAFQGGVSGFWFFFFAITLGGLAWWTYHRLPVSLDTRKRWILFSLRLGFLLALALLLLRPVLAFTVEGSVRRALLVLVDGSASMGIRDPRTANEDRQRAAIAAGELEPGDTNSIASATVTGRARLEVARNVLQNEKLDLLTQLSERFDVLPFSFGADLTSLPRGLAATNDNQPAIQDFVWIDRLKSAGKNTAIGEAMREVVNRKRGQPLAGVLLITDGANNAGLSPREAALQLQQENVPLYIYGVGVTSPRDIIVTNLSSPEVAFVEDEVLINVRVRAQGLKGAKSKVYLKIDGVKQDEKEIIFGDNEEQIIGLRFLPKKEGEFEIEAGVEAREDETESGNNWLTRRIRVVDKRIQVLLVEETPRWEYRYLHAMLSRDRRIDLKTVLYEGDPSITHGEESTFLERFPPNRDELFSYDLVILGDIDPRRLSRVQMANLTEFVSRFGGAFVMVAGKRHAPNKFRRTPIEDLLPVEFNATIGDGTGEVTADKPIHLELTTAGRRSTMLQFSDQAGENIRQWKNLPPVYWVARVLRAKPGAEVLLVDPNPVKASRFGPMPVVAVQQYGLGQSMFVGTDNTWRWRRNVGDEYYYTFWGQIIQRLSLSHMLGGSRRSQISLNQTHYTSGERARVFARLYRAGFEPVTDSSVKAFHQPRESDGSFRTELTLRPVPDQPGLYRGDFIAPAAGEYEFGVDLDPDETKRFYVSDSTMELGDTAMNESVLREMAELSGGRFFREETLHELPAAISAKTEKIRSPMEVELWSSPLYFLLILVLVTVEWTMRKLAYLK
ncbi:MAG: VWA domain-containing protein [Verrucomicrobiia bacterium]